MLNYTLSLVHSGPVPSLQGTEKLLLKFHSKIQQTERSARRNVLNMVEGIFELRLYHYKPHGKYNCNQLLIAPGLANWFSLVDVQKFCHGPLKFNIFFTNSPHLFQSTFVFLSHFVKKTRLKVQLFSKIFNVHLQNITRGAVVGRHR